MAAHQFGDFDFFTRTYDGTSAAVTLVDRDLGKRLIVGHLFTKDELLGLSRAALDAARELKG